MTSRPLIQSVLARIRRRGCCRIRSSLRIRYACQVLLARSGQIYTAAHVGTSAPALAAIPPWFASRPTVQRPWLRPSLAVSKHALGTADRSIETIPSLPILHQCSFALYAVSDGPTVCWTDPVVVLTDQPTDRLVNGWTGLLPSGMSVKSVADGCKRRTFAGYTDGWLD